MTDGYTATDAAKDREEIRALIERWSQAVRNQDTDGIRADHDSDILLFDLPKPLSSRGIEPYMATWDAFLAWSDIPVVFDLRNLEITAGADVAFATAIGRCAGIDRNGKREALEFRLTLGLRKSAGGWRVVHEHHSLPSD